MSIPTSFPIIRVFSISRNAAPRACGNRPAVRTASPAPGTAGNAPAPGPSPGLYPAQIRRFVDASIRGGGMATTGARAGPCRRSPFFFDSGGRPSATQPYAAGLGPTRSAASGIRLSPLSRSRRSALRGPLYRQSYPTLSPHCRLSHHPAPRLPFAGPHLGVPGSPAFHIAAKMLITTPSRGKIIAVFFAVIPFYPIFALPKTRFPCRG
jgi:hypothetical protein